MEEAEKTAVATEPTPTESAPVETTSADADDFMSGFMGSDEVQAETEASEAAVNVYRLSGRY